MQKSISIAVDFFCNKGIKFCETCMIKLIASKFQIKCCSSPLAFKSIGYESPETSFEICITYLQLNQRNKFTQRRTTNFFLLDLFDSLIFLCSVKHRVIIYFRGCNLHRAAIERFPDKERAWLSDAIVLKHPKLQQTFLLLPHSLCEINAIPFQFSTATASAETCVPAGA